MAGKMKGKNANPVRITERLIWIAIGSGALFWILESFVHVFIFHEGTPIQQILTPRPHEIWMRLIVVAAFIAFGVYAQFIITQRSRAKEATKHAYSELNQIFETAADGMRVVDKDFNVLRYNQTFLTLSGVNKSEAAGRKCYEVLGGSMCHTPECPLTRILRGEERVECDVKKERHDGVTVPCIVTATRFVGLDGQLIGVVENFKDISERKQAEVGLRKSRDKLEHRVEKRTAELTKANERLQQEITERKLSDEALRDSEGKYRTLVENLPQKIFLKDKNSVYVSCNKAFIRDLGITPEEFAGKTDYDFFPKKLAEKYREDDERIMKSGNTEEMDESYIQGGEERIVHTVKTPVRDELDNTVGILGIFWDITEQKRMQEKLKEYADRLEEMVEERTKDLQEAQDQLVRREKLAVLGQLAGGVSHELRNPIGAIKNAAYFLNMAIQDGEPEVKEALEILEKEVNTSDAIISGMLDFARPKPANRLKVGVNDVVHEGLSRVRVPENVEVVNQLNGTLSTILADPDQLSQVFRNLIHNAIQAMPEGGRLDVKTEAPSPEWVTVSFSDTGTGIDEETLGKVFEPLFTTKARGIGLGLSLTKMLIEAHGGTIEVQSEVGKGSTFTVKLSIKD